MKKLNAKLEKIANDVGVAAHSDPQTTKFDCRGGRLCPPAKKQNGITLIALIITIIVMLILVGVTINVALNGGIFGKAKDATFKTKISQIQEGLLVKKAEVVAGNNGKETPYNLTIDDLDIANELKNEYGSKLKIGADGKLYYDSTVVTNTSEQSQLEAVGINEYVEIPAVDSYTFTIADVMEMKEMTLIEDAVFCIPFSNFWIDNVSEDLKNSTITRSLGEQQLTTYNITCENASFTNGFLDAGWSGDPNSFVLYIENTNIIFFIIDEYGEPINSENYTSYADLKFTISMP